MLDAGDSISINVGKRFSSTSNSSRLGTLAITTGGCCTLKVESSLEMEMVSPMLWNEMLSAFTDLIVAKDGRMIATEGVGQGLKNEPSVHIFIFLVEEEPTSIALDSLFYCLSWKPLLKLAIISFFFFVCFNNLDRTTCSNVSLYSTLSILDASSGTTMDSWAYRRATKREVFCTLAYRGAELKTRWEEEVGVWHRVPS